MMGFHHTLDDGGRGLHAQRSAGGDCSVSSGVLSPGFIRRGAGPWRGTSAAARRRGDRLAHTVLRTRSVLMCSKIVSRFSNALIPGGLPALHRRVVRQERRGVIRPRVQGRPTAFARPAVLRAHQNGGAVLGTAPAPAPFWLRCSTSRYATDQVNTNESQTMFCEASHHQVRGRRTVRANQSREGTPRPDVARRAGRVVGNQFGRRLKGARSPVGFLPVPRTQSVLVCERIAERFVNPVNGGVSASEGR